MKIEGKDTDDWLCVDFGKLLVNIWHCANLELFSVAKELRSNF